MRERRKGDKNVEVQGGNCWEKHGAPEEQTEKNMIDKGEETRMEITWKEGI